MTNKEFFDIVKDKRIRWSTWSKDEYFIPTTIKNERQLFGYHFRSTNSLGTNKIWWIERGFSPNSSGRRWILLNQPKYIVME